MTMPIPATMRYVDHGNGGGPEVLSLATREVPELGAGEVLIEVVAAGVNRPDCIQRSGRYPPPADASPHLGLEVAGRIVALGQGVTEWKLGEAVCALANGGGYADYAAAPAGQVLPVPAGLTMLQAAALPETYFTVWANLVERGRLAAGDTVLIHGGSSGIGITAIQIAKALGMPLKIAAKVDAADARYFQEVIEPMLDDPLVEFVGEIGDDAKSEFLGGAAALLFPIDWPEPFGLVMIEAMACGTPVVAWRCGSTSEIVEPGKTGRIVETMEEAITAVQEVMSLDRADIRARFELRFSAQAMGRRYVALYADRLAGCEYADVFPLSAFPSSATLAVAI
jgi:hypothetical protein